MTNEELRMRNVTGSILRRASARRRIFCILNSSSFIFSVLLLLVLPVQPAAADVLRLDIHDTIHPITVEYITRGIDAGKEQHADAVLIRISTPGGLSESTREIIQQIVASAVPVIIYVAP